MFLCSNQGRNRTTSQSIFTLSLKDHILQYSIFNGLCKLVVYVVHVLSFSTLGKDGTEAFEDVGHSPDARELQQQYLIGEVDIPSASRVKVSQRGSDRVPCNSPLSFFLSLSLPLSLFISLIAVQHFIS